MAIDPPALLVQWERTLGDLLDRTQNFPKAVRFTFAGRIDQHALDVFERLVLARYAQRARKLDLLREADGHLALLRALLRLACDRRYLDRGGFEHVTRNLDEAGQMLGGWLRQLQSP